MYKFYYTNGYGVTSYIQKSATSLWQTAWHPSIRKWLMRVNLTCVMLLIAFMQVSLASNAQKISLSKKNAPLTEVFKELRKQSGYDFVINKNQIKIAKPVTIMVNGDDLINVLNKCFEDQPFSYSMEDKMIIVVNKKVEQVNINFPPIDVKGRLVDENGVALVGASVMIKGTDRRTVTNDNGEFSFTNVDEKAILVISFIGYEVKEVSVTANLENIKMVLFTGKLDEVNVVSTGYQNISPERTTGSFTKPDKTMLDARVSTDIISRLEGITSGLMFNGKGSSTSTGNARLAIRGLSTINAERAPLIVVDNFPYDGDISNINPNDVADITVLKDAAAASIWGAFSGNGVIVITTKKGKRNQPLMVNFNANTTIAQKPDLYYDPAFIPSSELIDLEIDLYGRGQYNSAISNAGKIPISPVVALLSKRDKGQISAPEFNNQIAALRTFDVRQQKEKYLYQQAFNQQYSINLSGGTDKNIFYMSAGYDKNAGSQKKSDYERMTLNFDNTYTPVKNLNINTGINYVRNNQDIVNVDMGGNFANLPYVRLADDQGNSLPVVSRFSPLYTETVQSKGFLNWDLYPLDELHNEYSKTTSRTNDIRLTSGVDYSFLNGFKASVKYQWQQGINSVENMYSKESYFTRNMINQFSIVNTSGNVTGYNLPIGAILSKTNNKNTVNNVRGQLDYFHKWGDHELNTIVGIEIREAKTEGGGFGYYGYDDATGLFANVNTTTVFPTNPSSSGTIPQRLSASGRLDRYQSFFANAAYTFRDRYTLTASGRIDQSNLFGVKANQRSNPLWSTGFRWDITKETFYHVDWLPKLAIKGTYGYNGNLSKSITAVTTFQYWPGDLGRGYTNLNSASVSNIGNPSLTWEKIGILNAGIDFAFSGNRLSGSIEFFNKRGTDLIGTQEMAPSTGVTTMRGNYATMRGNGFDIQLNSININKNRFRWESSFLISHATDEITRYTAVVNPTTNDGRSLNPQVGYPVYSVIAFRSAGLDPQTGNPRGYDKDGNVSVNYASLINPTNPSQLIYKGPGRPTVFGGLRNSVTYRNLSFSFNLSYKFNYYFLRSGISYDNLFTAYQLNSDYLTRWKKPGDERITNVPSITYTSNRSRDTFYQLSEDNIEKGDHIRLQDISLNYSLPINQLKTIGFKSIQIYGYANNLGVLWKATKTNLDPDFIQSSFVDPKTFAFGIKAGF